MLEPRRKRDRYLESWWPEIIASVTSLASVAAIFGCLLAWNGKPIFEWYRVTPNTVVAILATVARICNGISVSSALGQFKWIWHHHKPRPLYDFALISGATAGPWDSLKLLVRTRSLSIMALGCWVTLLVLAFDTFVQQIVAFRTVTNFRETPSNAIPYASTWNGGEAIGAGMVIEIDENGRRPIRTDETELVLGFPMQGAIITGLSADDSQISQQIVAICPTGNCRWESYQTLGVCSQCNDLNDILERREIPEQAPMANSLPLLNINFQEPGTLTEWFLPNGLRINNANVYPDQDLAYAGTSVMTAQVGYSPQQTISFQEASTLLLSISILKVDQLPDNSTSYLDWAHVPVSAIECGLYFCIQELNTTMLNGTLHDTSRVVSSRRAPSSFQKLASIEIEDAWPEPSGLFSNHFWVYRSDLQLEPTEDDAGLNKISSTNITQIALDTLIVYLNETFDGRGTVAPNGNRKDQLAGVTGMVIAAADRTVSSDNTPYVYSPPILSTLWLADDIPALFANLAKSMTNSMRTTSSNPSLGDFSSNTTSLLSTVSSLEGFQVTTLAVRWEWLILPAACVVLGVIFLLLAINQSRRHKVPLWKAHALASVLHGFERVPSTDPYDDARITQMERFAKGTLVSLVAKDREDRSSAWFLDQVPGGALHGQSGTPMVDRSDRGSATATLQSANPLAVKPPRYSYLGLGGELEEPLFGSGSFSDVYAPSRSTDATLVGSASASRDIVPQSRASGDWMVPRKPLRGSGVTD